ncbi:far upstream element-binding protein 1-like isoform X2 [Artemia franciscana]|uniref:far upstream element-binding protein 1-like isoform X2 n=1 Tax=Artemia franciscana TaxID=6661 RepID=UPI0032DBEAC6
MRVKTERPPQTHLIMGDVWDNSSWSGNTRTFSSSKGRGMQRGFQNRENQSSNDGENIEVASSMVARIIGRGGSKIKELEESSGCRIKILKDQSSGETVVISLSGGDISEAKRLIEEVTNSTGHQRERFGQKQASGFSIESNGSNWGEPSPCWDGQNSGSNHFKNSYRQRRSPTGSSGSSEKIRIDASLVARVIGRGGAKIRELQDKSGCRIQILKEESDEQDSVISISGRNIEEAKRLIMEIVEPFDAQKNIQNLNIADSLESSEKMKIDPSFVARIIGRGGAKIRELQDRSGCRIQILKEESDERESVISISGSNIEEAKRLIMEIVEPFDVEKRNSALEKFNIGTK